MSPPIREATQRPGALDRGRLGRVVSVAIAVLLVALTLWIARPAAVWGLLVGARPALLAAAAAASLAALVFRGLRLVQLLPPGQLGLRRGVAVAVLSQAAATFVPARLGELALPALLKRTAGRDFSASVGTLLTTRTLDVAALGAWLAIASAVLAEDHGGLPAALAVVLLVVPPLLLPTAMAVADRTATRCLAPRGRRARRWARRVRRVRYEIERVAGRRGRLTAAFAASLAMWAALWTLAWLLLRAMGFGWSWWTVTAGSAIASGTNLLPVNAVGNLGTLEAGWTAAFVVLGVPLEVAAATGLACHLWSLVFIAVYGAAAWALLGRGSGARTEG